MGKRYGEPYNPEMRESEHGAKLYNAWKKVRRSPHCEEWESYLVFYNWAIQSGYTLGAWLRLVDDTGEYSPDNCTWYVPGSRDDQLPPPSWADDWNRTVNRIRKHYGMPPLGGDSDA